MFATRNRIDDVEPYAVVAKMRRSSVFRFCGRGAVLLFALLIGSGCGKPEPLNVVLISIDTLRADHLGCYGYDKGTTPNLDRFAERSLRFAKCISPVPVTLPSHTSMFTGMIPPRHSVRDNGTFTVPDDLPTLATVLKGEGYATIGVIGAFPLISTSGFARGFDIYDESFESHRGGVLSMFFDERKADQVTRRAQEYLRQHQDEPFFLFVHYFDVHQTWTAPEPYASAFRQVPYDAEVAFTDRWVGELLDSITGLDLDQRTVVIVTADHGEGLMEHGEASHSMQIYNTTQHVPLFVSAPGVAAGVVEHPVGLIDIAPTVVELLGLPPLEDIDGVSLLHPTAEKRLLYCETLVGRLVEGWNDLRGCVVGDFKFIRASDPELYNLTTDFAERHNVAAEYPEIVRDLDAQVVGLIRDRSSTYRIADRYLVPDEEVRANLRALGYLSTSVQPVELEELVAQRPDGDPMLHLEVFNQINIAKQRMAESDFLTAITLLERALDVNSESHTLLKTLVSALVMTRDYTKAADHADKLLTLVGDDPSALRMAAAAFRGVGDYQRARELIDLAIERQSEASSYSVKAKVLFDLGDVEGALAAYEAGLRANPCSRDLLVELATAFRNQNMAVDARSTYQSMIDCGVKVAQARFNLGNMALETGDLETAGRHYVASVRADPFYAPGHYGMAVVHLSAAELGDARVEAQEALRFSGAGSAFGSKAAELLVEIESRMNG